MSIHEDFVPFSHSGEADSVDYTHGWTKRMLDHAIAIPALILLAPLLFVLAVIVGVGSEGPVLFRQTRLGLNGVPFQILKFRTMTVMENGPVIKQAEQGDVRVTKAGAWMRRLSLDELPQLINVVNGEMSVIGPRPHALAHDIQYGAEIRGYELRQSVKPGITGWAQVHGHRGLTLTTSSMRERLAYDVWYARNASLLLDLKILFRTVGEVIGQRNAF